MLLYGIDRVINPAIFSNISINVNLVENLQITTVYKYKHRKALD